MHLLPSIAARLGLVLCSLTLSVPLAAQDPVDSKPSPEATKAFETDAKAATEGWIRDLGSETFRKRSKAESALRAIGEAALPGLKQAAANDDDPEVQWRARRLVRQIEEGREEGLSRRVDREPTDLGSPSEPGSPTSPSPQGRGFRRFSAPSMPEDMQKRFDELFFGLERDFGVDIPRARFFRDDFFADLEQQMEEVRSQMQSMSGTGHGMSMQMGPDGVRVEIKTKNDKGEEESKVYEAKDLETFQKQYPGVLEGSGLGTGLQNRFHFSMPMEPGRGIPGFPQVRVLGPRNWGTRTLPQSTDDDGFAEVAPPPSDRRLGVIVRPAIGEELLQHLGIDGGLMVDEVQADSLASALQIQPSDIVTKIGDRAIASTQDVQDALATIEAGEEVAVTVVRRGKPLVLRAAKPAAKAEEATPLQKRSGEEPARGESRDDAHKDR